LRLLPHLDLTLPRSQATAHLPTLATHLSVLASASNPTLPKDTLAFLRPLLVSPVTLEDVLRVARALHDLSTLENGTPNGASAGAAACAMLLLALEAHAHPPRSAPHALVLAAQLGTAVGARGAAVMAHYRVLVDIIEAGAARVPWLAGANATGSKRLSRRSGVARAVLDVLQFRDELERAAVNERGGPINVDFEAENDGGEEGEGNECDDEAGLDALILKAEQKATENTWVDTHAAAAAIGSPIRKPRKPRTAASQAACFLLDPLAHNAPARATLAHTTYLLSSDAAPGSAPPTRLQLLTAERGNAEAIHDDELFGDDELEGIVVGTDEQAREEREKRAQTLRMMWGDEAEDADAARIDLGIETGGKSRKKRGKERVDLNKLAALLESDDAFTTLGVEELSPCEEEMEHEDAAWVVNGGDEEVVSEWRPASPGGCGIEWE
jgi:transcription factor IIIB 90 kDa subunit